MKTKFQTLFLLLTVVLLSSCGNKLNLNEHNESKAQKAKDVKKLVKEAVAYAEKMGFEKAFEAINDKQNPLFHKKKLYVFVYDFSGTCVAHGQDPGLIGKSLITMRDLKGKQLVRGLVEKARRGGGWFDYFWTHPITGNMARKKSYVLPANSYVYGSGYFSE